ncbi:targeting protein for Xklp2-like [Ischnura elegans]|uniref:targeting protein for Xklp2-like n=1 Tax=Ischnura elegans TaxID=197161 RepID=UPI001ED8A621|nr:targeting protein for Xklp2-like [Ischnura elegans]
MDKFEFNVPRFTDFNACSDSDDEELEKYFDFDHEDEDQFNAPSQSCSFQHKGTGGNNMESGFGEGDESCSSLKKRKSVFKTPGKTPRKSELETLCSTTALYSKTPKKFHSMETRLDSAVKNPPLSLRSRNIFRASVAPEEDCDGTQMEDKRGVRRKRVHSPQNKNTEKYICLAEEVLKFHNVTPARFHTKPKHEKFYNEGGKWKVRGSTIPKSPHLNVLKRTRPTHVLSRKELEDLEVEEMKRHQVKARPINDKIFKPPNINRSHRSFQLTMFEPFNLTEPKQKTEEVQPEVYKFTARPVPKGLFKKVDVKNTSAPTLLQPSHSPRRVRVPVQKGTEKENKVVHKPPRKGPIKATPFSFYDKDVMRLQQKEKKIQQLLEEEKKQHTFRANPLPKFPEKPFQEKPTMDPTIPQPFHLSADDKGKVNREKWEKMVEEEKLRKKRESEFKARPPVILNKKPFVPVKTEKHEVRTLDVHLNTEIRAKDRALYDLKMQMRQKEIEEIKLQRQKELEKMKEEELARLRKEIVHKANPVRHYKEVVIHPANKCLTVPLSPKSFIVSSHSE